MKRTIKQNQFVPKKKVGKNYIVMLSDSTDGEKVVVDQFVFDFDPKDYDKVVTHIIRERYSADKMEALLNNYLLDAEKYKEEFEAMQEWRAFAKESAKKIVSL